MTGDSGARSLIDLARYPLGDPDSATLAAVIDRAREQMAACGFAELEGFVHADGVAGLVDDAERLAGRAHRSGGVGTAYLGQPDESLPADHPARWRGRYSVGAVAYDLFPLSSPLRILYESECVLRLVEEVLDRGRLYPYADPFGALNLAVMEAGDELQWHFDQVDFVVSLAIRSSDAGGDFEVAPLVRTPTDESYPDVAAVLAGDRSRVERIAMRPGTLLLFEGRHSLHRVGPVIGATSRLVGLLAYDTRPDRVGSDYLRQDRYGRTQPIPSPS